jgi:aminoglycoside phosphotransferase (APT) family kinase protein
VTPGGAAHGDFAPWNLLRTQDGWALVDWENFRVAAPPFFDLFHYIVQSNSELRRPLKGSIMRGLRLEGWVGRSIQAYADGAGVDARDGAHSLREYLMTSAATLELQAPRRGVRVRSKLATRLASEHPTVEETRG